MLKKYYEVVGLFSSIEELNQTVKELFVHGFDSFSLNVLASNVLQQPRFRIRYKNITSIVDDPNVPKEPFYGEENVGIVEGAVIGIILYISTVIAVGVEVSKGEEFNKFFIVVLAAFLISSLIGILIAIIINKRHQKNIINQLRKGGIPLWVRVEEKSKLDLVGEILSNNGAKNIHLLNVEPQYLEMQNEG